jgi:hypothetical protein
MLSIFRLSVIHLLRQYIPNSTLRNVCVVVIFILLLLGIIIGAILGLHPPPTWKDGFRSREFINNLGGLLAIINNSILIIPTFLTIKGALKLIANSKVTLLLMTAPVSPITKFLASIGPLIFFAALSFLVFTSPFIIMFLFLDPLISVGLMLYFIILSGWCVTLCLASLVAMVHFFGKDKTMRLANLIPIVVLILPMAFVAGAENFRRIGPLIGSWQLMFLVVSLIILPVCFTYVSSLFFVTINFKTDELTKFKEPKWGYYSPWEYIRRSPAVLVVVPFFVFILLMSFKIIEFEKINQAIFAGSVYFLTTLPVSILMSEERKTYTRWLLAPNSSKIILLIWSKVNMPLFIIATILVCLNAGAAHITWSAAIILFVFLGLILLTSHKMYKHEVLRNLSYCFLMLCCMVAQLIW